MENSAAWAFAALSLAAIALCRAASRAEGRRVGRPLSRVAPYLATIVVAVVAVCSRPLAGALTIGVASIALVAAAPVDWRTGHLVDAVTLPATIVVLACSFVSGRTDLAAAGVSLVAGFFFALVVISRGTWMGLGDVKAIFAISAAFGPIEATLAIFVACLSGIALTIARTSRPSERQIPFGPHLAAGTCAILALGPTVETWMHLT